jgi:glutamyl-Q tRNA(Asp) synthetase
MMYRGRFAPSPTGELHFGSLVAALASYLDARHHQGAWLVRMEDLDPPREIPGAASAILRALEIHGLHWDETVIYQSQRDVFYQHTIEILFQSKHIYYCLCSRSQLAQTGNRAKDGSLLYPGTCRELYHNKGSLRFRTDNLKPIQVPDLIQPPFESYLATDVGDFIIKRRDGLWAYQLAVVVDDAAQNITRVVRGADLLDSTPRQIAIQQCLGLATPEYAHLPVVTDAHGEKLSKQTFAPTLNATQAPLQLWHALAFLGQNPPQELKLYNVTEILSWAIKHWSLANIPRQTKIHYPLAL